MATAWQSEYFDKSTPGQPPRTETRAPAAAMGAQATPPAMYHDERDSAKGRGTTIVSLALRVLTLILSLVAVAVLASSKGTFGVVKDNETTLRHTINFTVLKAFTFLFAACCIVAVYSLAMTTLNLISLFVKSLASNKILLWVTFVCDQALAYLLISAGAVGANGVIASTDDENITGLRFSLTCDDLGISGFCGKAGASVGIAFAAFLFLAITSVLSARRLFRR